MIVKYIIIMYHSMKFSGSILKKSYHRFPQCYHHIVHNKYNAWPSQWYDNYPNIGHDIIKLNMTRRKFLWTMGYLHWYYMNKKFSRENIKYTLFDVKDFQKNMDNWFNIFYGTIILGPVWTPYPLIWMDEFQGRNYNKIGTLWYQNLCCDWLEYWLCSQVNSLHRED